MGRGGALEKGSASLLARPHVLPGFRRHISIVLHLPRHGCAARPLVQRIPNFQQHTFAIFHPLIVPEAHFPDAFADEIALPFLITLTLFGQAVMKAIQFDGQLRVGTKEIEIVSAVRMLAAEFEAGEATGAQGAPQLLFLVGLVAPEFAGDRGGIHPDRVSARLERASLRASEKSTSSPQPSPPLGVEEREFAAGDLHDLSRLLPEIVPSSGVLGESRPGLLGPPIPIAGIAGDQQAALFGQGCVAAGMAKNTYGTGAFLLLYAGETVPAPPTGLLATAACNALGGLGYALEGSVFIAGAVMQWLRDGLGLLGMAAESEALARSVPDTGGVSFVPAFVGLGSPYWEPEARGTVTGLSRGTTRAHVVRAALESMAHSSRELLETLVTGTGLAVPRLRVDGGAATNDWLMQFQADILGVPVERLNLAETTALGAAGLAGLAVGVWPGVTEFGSTRQYRVFVPQMAESERTFKIRSWERAVSAALHWARA